MFPVFTEPDTGKFGQDIYATHAGFGCAALGHAMFCHHGTAATDYLGSIEYFEYGPAFCNANLKDYFNLRDSLSKNVKDYKLKSGKDKEIKELTEYVVDNDKDESRILERIGKFCRSDYIYDEETGRYDTKRVDEKEVAKKDYDDYYKRNYKGTPTKSRHADDYANDEIADDTREQIDAVYNAAPECAPYNLAYADGKWQLIDGNGVVGLGKDVGPNGTFLRFEILEMDGKAVDHVDRQDCYKEVYDMQQDYFEKLIAKGELPDWSTFDHVLDDSGTYKLYDGIDSKGNVTLPEDTKGKNDAWVKLNMDGTGELEWYGFHSKVAWCSNAGTLTCCSSDAKACASFSGWIAARETRDTTGCRRDGKSREHGIDARLLYIKDGKYVEQFFHVLEPYGESMQLFDTDNIEQDGYRFRLLKDQGKEPGSYGKSPWK